MVATILQDITVPLKRKKVSSGIKDLYVLFDPNQQKVCYSSWGKGLLEIGKRGKY